ncbi:DUF2273 domain-containing protein [Dermatophilaceae bacterium Sec6.4]|nr:DUF2273 domain-containing protein [Actinomycetota bacterium]
MNRSALGLLAGLLMAVAIIVGGFYGFLVALVLGVIGYVVGAHLDGDLDLSRIMPQQRDRRG